VLDVESYRLFWQV